MKLHQQDQRGFATIIVVIAVVVVLLGGVGYVAWNQFGKQAVADVTMDAATRAAKDECEKKNDKDICRFVTNWKKNDKYRITSVSGSGNKSVITIDGKKTHMASSGELTAEIISIDNTTYTKAGGVWYKQTTKTPEQNPGKQSEVEFKEPADEGEAPTEDKTTYKKLAKEACGKLQCFKYEVVNPDNADSKEFIWFDDQDYKLRKSVTQSPDSKSEQTFDYDNVSVAVPSPVKELAADEYLMPGTTEPVKFPSAANLQ